ncbi:MAG: 30S ribosomal protein S20 [Ignavibacteriales bacterium]|jgi:small subunit ribosomal protein S20|nr:30S ribosomal protein S20 [Ignavibacteriales bacterium]MBP9119892.1 30S ribosomal protein S20 [Ignavibacterium sp.]RPI64774.1 MAG: 30S ribosomal protein S20 [Ignavibacteriales bacterium]
MAHHKSAKKRIRSSERKKAINKMTDSKIKTVVKKTLASDKKEELEVLYKEAIAILDKGTSKGRLHKNNAARKKSKLTKHLNKVTAVAK